MNLIERIQLLVSALPSDDAAVTLTRADLAAMVEGSETPAGVTNQDLTVDEVAAETRRAPSTVRSWLISGELVGYKLNGREWRIPSEALRGFLDAQSDGSDRRAEGTKPVDISEWRRGS